MTLRKPRIAVLGSINMDLLVRCDSLPQPGETILANSSKEICGGKGVNQAVAAARAGGAVTMIGRVGDDAFASRLRSNLLNEQINCDYVRESVNCASGLAVVAVEQSGQNSIIVVPGANGQVTRDDVDDAAEVIRSSDVLLLQLEVPLPAACAAKRIASEAGVRVILDPAPAPSSLPNELYDVDFICPNESEVAALTGFPVSTFKEAEAAARKLQSRGARAVAITMGAHGSLLLQNSSVHMIDPIEINAVDTTAAGDAFTGAFAVRWAENDDMVEATRSANAAGALAASREGAQPAMATRSEIDELIAKYQSSN